MLYSNVFSGEIGLPPRPSSLLDQLTMDKSDGDGFFSRRLVCRTILLTLGCNRLDYNIIIAYMYIIVTSLFTQTEAG